MILLLSCRGPLLRRAVEPARLAGWPQFTIDYAKLRGLVPHASRAGQLGPDHRGAAGTGGSAYHAERGLGADCGHRGDPVGRAHGSEARVL